MKLVDTDETVVIVTGSGLPAEEKDRPLAYHLKAEIDRRGHGFTYRRAVVVSDLWYLDSPIFHLNPTVAVGGPGANAVARQMAGALPVAWHEGDHAYVQADLDSEVKRAALWGMDGTTTAAAVQAFMERGFLDALLERIWRFRSGTIV